MECGGKCTHAIDDARSADDYRSVHNTAPNSTAVCVYSTDATCLHLYRHHTERLINNTLECQTHQQYMIPWAFPWCLRACFVLFGLRRVRLLCCCAPSKNKPPHDAEQ